MKKAALMCFIMLSGAICTQQSSAGQIQHCQAPSVTEAGNENCAVSVTPTTLDFGYVNAGGSKTMSFCIENNRDSTVLIPMLTESFGNFSLDWNGDSIPRKTKQMVYVTYSPTLDTDGDSLQLMVRWNDMGKDESIAVNLYGQCINPDQQPVPLAIKPNLLDFSQMVIGETKEQTLYITNQSYETQRVIDFSENVYDGFSVDWKGGEIGPGVTQEVKVIYTAVQKLSMTSFNLTIGNEEMLHDGSSVIVPVWISAEEAPTPVYAISVFLEEMVFENVAEGDSQTKKMTICNNTGCEVDVRDFSSDNEQFTMDWNGGSLQAGEIRAVHVTYAPIKSGTSASASISLATTEMDANDEYITVSITGTAADIPTYETAKTHLVLVNRDGSSVAFFLEERPRVSFADSSIFIETTRLSAHYDSDSFLHFIYATDEDIQDEIIQIDAEDIPFSQENEHLNFMPGAEDLKVRVITAGGNIIRQLIVHKGEILSLSLDLFETGVYLIEVNGETYKLFLR